jgi:hypothetical protein
MKTNYPKTRLFENNGSEGEDGPILPAETPSTPPGSISSEEAKNLIKATNGKFFTVTFIKKDGTERVMNARLGVKKYLQGGTLAFDAESKGLIPVFDLQAPDPEKAYRMVSVDTISKLKIGGNTYTVVSSINENEEEDKRRKFSDL